MTDTDAILLRLAQELWDTDATGRPGNSRQWVLDIARALDAGMVEALEWYAGSVTEGGYARAALAAVRGQR